MKGILELEALDRLDLLFLARLAYQAEELARFNSTPEWRAWHAEFAEVAGPEPEEDFVVEVRMNGVTPHLWLPAGKARSSIDLARAVAEDLRTNHGHANSAIRIMQGDKMVQLILPGDPPVAELAKQVQE